ncbi:MAG: hypothetical protein ACI4ML_00685 [Aristaeellaceae bacterium]
MDDMLMDQPWRVLVRVDDAGRVVAINSSAFVQDDAGWVEIDSGFGDRCHHAQGNYLPGPLVDERGVYRYALVDSAVVERTAEEMDADCTPKEPAPTLESRVEAVEGATQELQEALDLLLTGVTE